MMEVLDHFRNGIEQYRNRNWDKAIHAFKQALQHLPNDKASKMYIERCEHFKKNPPEPDWKGVWVMDHK